MFAGGPDICRKHGEEQNRKANRGRARSERDQQSGSSQDFKHACNGDNYCRSWEGGWDHSNQIGASPPPMGGGGDQKHHKKADAKRQIPIIQSRDTEQPREAKNGEEPAVRQQGPSAAIHRKCEQDIARDGVEVSVA